MLFLFLGKHFFMFFVYILYSPTSDTFYRGQTNDIDDRLRRHNSYQEHFTSKGVPWKLIWFTKKVTRSQALTLEKKLKNMSREKLIQFMNKYKADCAGPDALIILDQWSGC
jgi:putative endonuclease